MSGEPEDQAAPLASTDEELGPWVRDPDVLAWARDHLPRLRRSTSKQHVLRWILGTAFVVGLLAHVSGYLLRSSATTGSGVGLLADMLYTFGWALWTGVVVVVFFQVVPDAKAQQMKRSVDALEAALRDQARARSDLASGNDQPSSRR